MKAILIKYLSPTNTQGVRLKATTEAGNMIIERDYEMESQDQARQLAIDYARDYFGMIIAGFGTLPNGDYVATLGE